MRWTIEELAHRSGVGIRTIKRLEAMDDITSVNLSTISKLRSCLETAGIELIGTPDDGTGIRIHAGR